MVISVGMGRPPIQVGSSCGICTRPMISFSGGGQWLLKESTHLIVSQILATDYKDLTMLPKPPIWLNGCVNLYVCVCLNGDTSPFLNPCYTNGMGT